ncbi:hypothetical protein VTL71DRAFT_12944 [Oculimacula yallundae]|uniref:BTB domain-containing protein n=1 Tax=Oculimacula yallundae TaxID=86028 RepID=A0ABR4CP45_9HELO
MTSIWPSTWPPPAEELYSFDLHGDVLFVLSRWTASEDSDDEGYDDSDFSYTPSLNGDDEDMVIEMARDLPTDDSSSEFSTAMEIDEALEEDDTQASGALTTVHMRVSSRHMSLGSPTFASMLGPDYKEGRDLQAQGSVIIPLPDDDPDTLIILLNIIHGKTRLVPREVDIDLLARLAALVDYYNFHEIVELWSDFWIDKIKLEKCIRYRPEPDQPTISQADALKRLFVSWVFQKADAFRKLSRDIEHMGAEDMYWEDRSDFGVDLEELDKLPIPQPIIDAINVNRKVAIQKVLGIVRDIIQRYSGPTNQCKKGGFKCDATVLGSFIKYASMSGLWPAPDDAFGEPLTSFTEILRDIDVVTSCTETEGQPKVEHGVDSFIEASLLTIEDSLCGLDIADFIPKERARMQV